LDCVTSTRVAIVRPAVVAFVLTFSVILLGPVGCGSGPAEQDAATIEERERDEAERTEGITCVDCNVILISLDTLRADRLGAYGYERPTSPNLDTLARESIVFRDVLAQAPTTAPSHASLLSGRYVFEHRNELDDVPMLAELLSARGYETAAFVDGGQMSKSFGMSKGFDSWFDTGGVHVKGAQVGGGLGEIAPQVISWLEEPERVGTTFFAMIHTYDVHCPYTPPEPYFSMFVEDGFERDFEVEGKCGIAYFNELNLGPEDFAYISALYDGGVRYADALLGEIFATIERLDLGDRTVVIVTSDHGEALGERGLVGHNRVFDVHLRVPLIVRLPTRLHQELGGPVQLIDLLPTLLGMLGVEAPEGLPGMDLRPAVAQGRLDPQRLRYAESGNGLAQTLRMDQRWTLIMNRGVPQGLYDLQADPEETDDLIEQHPEIADRLRAAFEQFTVSGDPVRDFPDDLSEAEIERLRALGYLR
jgi:arylsulfatase A-like enzyme